MIIKAKFVYTKQGQQGQGTYKVVREYTIHNTRGTIRIHINIVFIVSNTLHRGDQLNFNEGMELPLGF